MFLLLPCHKFDVFSYCQQLPGFFHSIFSQEDLELEEIKLKDYLKKKAERHQHPSATQCFTIFSSKRFQETGSLIVTAKQLG